jgi:uncharacterized RDD family membrane protein YckC
VSTAAELAAARRLQGRRAGLVTRLFADAVDLVVVLALVFLVLLVIACVRFLVGDGFQFDTPSDSGTLSASGVLLVAYLAFGWATTGRTAGKNVAGLRVVCADGGDVSALRGIARALLSVAFIPGLLWAAVSRRNASIQDLIVRTAVVYDWGHPPVTAPAAHPPSPPAR